MAKNLAVFNSESPIEVATALTLAATTGKDDIYPLDVRGSWALSGIEALVGLYADETIDKVYICTNTRRVEPVIDLTNAVSGETISLYDNVTGMVYATMIMTSNTEADEVADYVEVINDGTDVHGLFATVNPDDDTQFTVWRKFYLDGTTQLKVSATGAATITISPDPGLINLATAGSINGDIVKLLEEKLIDAAEATDSCQANVTQAKVKLAAGDTAANDDYNGMTVIVEKTATGVNQCAKITDYDATTKLATVDRNWIEVPTTGFTYIITSGIEEYNRTFGGNYLPPYNVWVDKTDFGANELMTILGAYRLAWNGTTNYFNLTADTITATTLVDADGAFINTFNGGSAVTGTSRAITGYKNRINLAMTASGIDDYYTGAKIVSTNDAVKEIRTIVKYIGAKRQAIVDRDWDTVPDNDDTYVINNGYLTEGLHYVGIQSSNYKGGIGSIRRIIGNDATTLFLEGGSWNTENIVGSTSTYTIGRIESLLMYQYVYYAIGALYCNSKFTNTVYMNNKKLIDKWLKIFDKYNGLALNHRNLVFDEGEFAKFIQIGKTTFEYEANN